MLTLWLKQYLRCSKEAALPAYTTQTMIFQLVETPSTVFAGPDNI